MAKKNEHNYFNMLVEMVECSSRAADLLEKILKDFKIDSLNTYLKELHAIEHEGDNLKHRLVEKLVREFITPIEREDIMAITSQIDDVTDTVEDVLLKIYMFNLQTIDPNAVKFVDIVKQCCQALLNVFKEFSDFKKSKNINTFIIELNRLEEEGDALYMDAVRALYTSDVGAKESAAWTEIFNVLEKCCDTCEHTADLVEHVIMKNS